MVRNAAAHHRCWLYALTRTAREFAREAEVAFEVFLVHLPLMVAHECRTPWRARLVLHRRQVDAPGCRP